MPKGAQGRTGGGTVGSCASVWHSSASERAESAESESATRLSSCAIGGLDELLAAFWALPSHVVVCISLALS
jgi:hypothetical protein